jgi:hypothetical protein
VSNGLAENVSTERAQLYAEWQSANEAAAAVLKQHAGADLKGSALADLAAAEARAASIAQRFGRVEPIGDVVSIEDPLGVRTSPIAAGIRFKAAR